MCTLRNGTAVITGAASDAGLEVVLMFARYQCERIFLGDLAAEKLEQCREVVTLQYPSVKIYVKAFDRSSEDEVDEFYAAVTQTFDRIDFSVNVVSGAQESTRLTGLSIAEYDRYYSIYQRGAFLIQRAVLRQMLKQEVHPGSECRGSIVNLVELGPTALLAHYPIVAAVANAVIGLSRTDAFDYLEDKIRINCIAASEVLTKGSDARPLKGIPSLREGRPDDVTSTAIWLSLPGSSWLTGMIIPVTGGRHLHSFW